MILADLAPTKVGQTTVNENEVINEVDASILDAVTNILTTDPDLLPMDTVLKMIGLGVGSVFGAGFGITKVIDMLKAGKGGKAGERLANTLEKSASAIGIDKPVNEDKEEDEMDKMEELKKELQEVNLLNAKLLYTNKIFNAKNLNESQKLRVLKAFDKATSVKEAKVIFETLNEGMVSKTAKSSMVNEIKGSASKATGVIRENRQPIVEVDPMVARWQKLAGIK